MVGRRSHGRWNVRPQCANIEHSRKKCHMCGQKTGFKQHEGAGQSPSPLLVVFSCFFYLVWLLPSQQGDSTRGRRWTWTGSWRSAAGRRWLLVDIGTSDVLGCSWMLHPSGFHHMFFQTRGSGIPLKVTVYFSMWWVVEHQMTVLYWFCYGCLGGRVLCQSGTLDEPEYVGVFK